MTQREILIEDLENMDEGLKALATTKEDIWQDKLVWSICKAVRDMLIKELNKNDNK